MKLYAIADLHLGSQQNQQALLDLPTYPQDWLIIAGDIGETAALLHQALAALSKRFAQLIWVPGNHDLWTLPSDADALCGEARYQQLVSICHSYGVLTPEDPYVTWPGEGSYILAPLFLLYDYSFRPAAIPLEQAVSWAEETHTVFTDEYLLHPDPYASRIAWCQARCQLTEKRLAEATRQGSSFILINHFPLQEYPISLLSRKAIGLWSGTRETENWHTRFPTSVVIYGHLHMRATYYRAGVRFEEVSLGYPRDWQQAKGIEGYLRPILPARQGIQPYDSDMVWHY